MTRLTTRIGVIIPALLLLFTSCSEEDKRNQTGGRRQVAQVRDDQFKPESSGGEFKVLVINDQIRRDSALQDAFGQVFREPYPALPQPEAWFRPSYVNADGFNKLHRRHKSVLLTSVIPNDKRTNRLAANHVFSQGELQEMTNTNGISIRHKWDVHSEPQLMMMVTAPSREIMRDSLPYYADEIRKWFNKQENRAMRKRVFSGGTKTALVSQLKNELDYYFLLPMGYEKEMTYFDKAPGNKLKANDLDHFAWYSLATNETVQNVMTYTTPFDDSLMTKQGLMRTRNQVTKAFVKGTNDDSYAAIEDRYTDVPLDFEETTINDQQVYVLKGLWRMKNDFMGGPFRLYAIPDKSHDQIIFIDGFVYAAGEDKKPLMKRVQAVMRSFKLQKSS